MPVRVRSVVVRVLEKPCLSWSKATCRHMEGIAGMATGMGHFSSTSKQTLTHRSNNRVIPPFWYLLPRGQRA